MGGLCAAASAGPPLANDVSADVAIVGAGYTGLSAALHLSLHGGGYNGRGIAPGTTFGRALARLVLGQVSAPDLSLPMSAVVPASLKPLKEAFYEVGAQAAHLLGARF